MAKTLQELLDTDMDDLRTADLAALARMQGMGKHYGMPVFEHGGERYCMCRESGIPALLKRVYRRHPAELPYELFEREMGMPEEVYDYLRESKPALLWLWVQQQEVDLEQYVSETEVEDTLGICSLPGWDCWVFAL